MQIALNGRHVACAVIGLLVGEECFEATVIVVGAVGAVGLAVDGVQDPVVVVAGGARVLVAAVAASESEVVTVPENLGAALCWTGDVALVVVPVVGPAVDGSLLWWHL